MEGGTDHATVHAPIPDLVGDALALGLIPRVEGQVPGGECPLGVGAPPGEVHQVPDIDTDDPWSVGGALVRPHPQAAARQPLVHPRRAQREHPLHHLEDLSVKLIPPSARQARPDSQPRQGPGKAGILSLHPGPLV